MIDTLSPDVIRWVERATGRGARLATVSRSEGATSSSVYFVTVTVAGRPQKLVLRLFTNETWLADEPDLAVHEAAVLRTAHRAGLPSPELIAYAADDAECGLPAVLMTFIEGRIELRPADFERWLRQLAERLVEVHQVRADDLDWTYFSWTNTDNLQPPAWSKYPQLWERAIEIGLNGPPPYTPVFIHRDYHPTNVLWAGQRLCGIVDWVNGCRGPAGVDLAHCRGNLTAMYGSSTAEQFLDAYRQVVGPGFVYHPYWDIDSLLDCLPEPGYYPPWQAYGLGPIAPDVLRARRDELLKIVMCRI